jgi:hypothetical protein
MLCGVVVSLIDLPNVFRDLPGFRDLDGLCLSELRVELADMRRVRAVVEARVVDIVARLEASMTAVGTHERGIPEVELVAHGGKWL